MKIISTSLKDCFIIEDRVFPDSRGYFFESFNAKRFQELTGLSINFIQDNQSSSTFGVLRGLHFQSGEHAQAKLVRVLKGAVLDVAVDIRKASPTFGQSFSLELTEDNHKQLFIPRGFAHGFAVLSETATFFYKCDNYYNKESECGIAYNDASLKIEWQLKAADIILSDKDKNNPLLKDILQDL